VGLKKKIRTARWQMKELDRKSREVIENVRRGRSINSSDVVAAVDKIEDMSP
jgi:hypothetical protein